MKTPTQPTRSIHWGIARIFALLLLLAVTVSGQDSDIRSRQWIVQLSNLPGNTREEQLAAAQPRFAAAQMAERGINIVDHLGRSGVLLVRSADEETEADLEAKLALVEGFRDAVPFNPRATNSSQIPVDVGPGYRKGAPGGITPLPDGTEYPHYESSIGYDGIANTGFRPPDPSGAAGPTVFIQGVNTQFTISNKATGATIASASAATFFAPLGGLLGFSDPVVVFNEHTQRFAVGIIDFDTTSNSRFDLAISKTANPATFTAADWNFFRYNADDASAGFDFADYPKMGYNADGYVVSFNQFKNASSYDHVTVLAIRNDGTNPGGAVVVPGGFNNFTLAPASSHDNPIGADDPFWFVQAGTSTTVIQAIQMTNPFAVAPTFTFNNLTVNAYFGPQSPHQPAGQLSGNSNLGDRFYFTGMRTIGGVTHLVAAHTSAKTSGNAFSEVRWYDLNVTGVPSVIQQGKIDAGANIDTYFPDIDIAADGAIGLGYMQSGSGVGQFISGYVTGRTPGDLLGTLQTPTVAKLGTANLTPADRIGDYADVSVDPADGSFWYTFEYVAGTGSQAWSTWVHNFSVAATFTVTSTAPAIGSIVSTSPTTYTVNFNSPYDLGSVGASDFTVNGTPASSFGVVDADSLTFTFGSSPAVEGLNTMAIAAGAITGNGSLPVNAFTGQFIRDTLPLTVTATSPPSGSVLVPGPASQTIRVSFNEPVALGTVQTADFVFSQGTVVSATPVGPGNTAVDVVLSGLVTEGALTLAIGVNAFTDVNGGPNPVGFAASYNLDYGTRPFPTPLIARNPAGSLIYDGSLSGLVNSTGDTDTFTLAVDAGQTLTVKVTPTAALLRPAVEIYNPANVLIGSATAAAANQNAVLQTAAATAGGTYAIVVSGAGGTNGSYTVQVTLNAALENEGILAGATNNTTGTAQDINSSFAAFQPGFPGAQRGAVLGTTDSASYTAAAVTPTFLDISTTGTISTATGDDSSQTLSGAQLAGFAFPFFGTNFTSIAFSTNGLITLPAGDTTFSNTDLSTSPSQAAIAVLWDDLENLNTGTGTSSSRIYWQVIGSGPGQQLVVQWNNVQRLGGSLLFTVQAVLSANGNIQFNYGSGVTTAAVVTNATVGIKADGTSNPPRTLISFNQAQGALVGPSLSTLITPPSSGPDYFAFALNAGETATVAVTGQSVGILNLELRDGGNIVLATGTGGSTNLTSVISNFTAATTGTYYARITGDSNVPYSLVVTRNAAFDTEGNSTSPTAQSLGGLALALGYLESGPLALETFETGNFSQFPWASSGNANWSVTNTAAATGTFSARSGVIADSQSSTLSVTLTTQAGNISFARRVSSESSFDFLRFSIDGVQKGSWSGTETSFTTVTFPVTTAGSHTFTWAYTKDGSVATGLDAAFIDNIAFPVAAGIGQDWYSLNVTAGTELGLATSTPGDGPGEFVNSLNPHLELYAPSGVLVAGGVASADGRNERLQHTAAATGTYRVRVTGEAGTRGEYVLIQGFPPVVTGNPSSQLVNVGSPASFSASATGDPAPAVQWQVSTDAGATFNDIPGAIAVPLNFNVSFAQNGNRYRAVFTNVVGSAPTTAATLTVNRPPVAGPVTVDRYPTQSVKVSLATILAQASDPDPGDSVSFVSVGTPTAPAHGTLALSGSFVFYTPNAGDQNADTFSYRVQDSHGAQTTGVVNVGIKVNNAPSLNITSLRLVPGGGVAIDFSGIPGYTYGLQFKVNLSDPVWTNIGPVTTDQVGRGSYQDGPPAQGTTSGFYRLIFPAP